MKNRTNLRLNLNSKILDVGSGAGQLLHDLKILGFSNLLGIDLFIEQDLNYQNGVRIIKGDINALNQQFDFIMLHHSFEHMPDPLPTLKKLHSLLKPNRYLLIRIPIADSYAWRKYGVNWLQLDAPRHLYVHTTKSMTRLAEESGFKVADVIYDSSSFGLMGSEQYLKDIPLEDETSYNVNFGKSIFTHEQVEYFDSKAAELNEKNDGDQACFYFYKA